MLGAWVGLVGLAGARARRRGGALLAVAVGAAAAAAAVLAATPLSLVAREAALERSLSTQTVAERALRVTIARAGGAEGGMGAWSSLDAQVRAGLPRAGFAPDTARAVRFSSRIRPRTGSLVLAGVDGAARWLRVGSGRAPGDCTAARCEVVAVGPARLPRALSYAGVHLVVVGRGRLDGTPLGPVPPPNGLLNSDATFLIARGVDPLLAIKRLEAEPRTFAWARVLDPAAAHAWNSDALLAGMAATRAVLGGAIPSTRLALPDGRLTAEAERGRAAAGFALLMAGLAAIVLLAFAAFAAAEQRDDVAAELTRLRAMAARPRHLAALVIAEAALPTLAGVLAGAALAAVAGVVASRLAGVDAAPVLVHGLLSSGAVSTAALLWIAAAGVVAGVLGSAQSRAVRAALEVGCAVALVALAWQVASRGPVDAARLASGGIADPALVLMPGVATLALGLLALRVVPPLLRALARAGERLPVGPYLALVALARRPGRTAAAVAVVAVSSAAATFALGHARTLQRGQSDQAAYRTAADFRALVPGERMRLGPGESPVLRLPAETLGTLAPVQVIGVGAQVLPHLPGWRSDFADQPIGELAKRLAGDSRGIRLNGLEIPLDARALSLYVRVGGTAAVVQLAVQRPDGTFTRLLPTTPIEPGLHRVVGRVGRRERGGRAVALEVSAPLGVGPISDLGTLVPDTLKARVSGGRTAVLGDFSGWQPVTTGGVGEYGGRVKFSYSASGPGGYLGMHPPQPAAREPVPVLATRELARELAPDARTLPVRLQGGGHLQLRVVGVVSHIPTAVPGNAVVADVGRLFSVLNTQYPGLGGVAETWVQGRDPRLRPELRLADLHAAAVADPLARGVLGALWALAALGALVALAAVALATAAAALDRGGEQAEMEAIGVGPRTLRAQMTLVAAVTAAAGLLAGLLGGAALTGAFTGLVALGADGRTPLPDLLPAFPWPLAVTVVGAVCAAAIVAAAVQAHRAFRGDALGRLRG